MGRRRRGLARAHAGGRGSAERRAARAPGRALRRSQAPPLREASTPQQARRRPARPLGAGVGNTTRARPVASTMKLKPEVIEALTKTLAAQGSKCETPEAAAKAVAKASVTLL